MPLFPILFLFGMKDTTVDGNRTACSVQIPQERRALCDNFALQGECERNPTSMEQLCGHSCGVLDRLTRWELTSAHTCPQHMPLNVLDIECRCNLMAFGHKADSIYHFCEADQAKTAEPCLVYSFGINNQIAFEIDLAAAMPHCEVWAFDNHSIATSYMLNGRDWHQGKVLPALPSNLHYRPRMLWWENLGANHVPLGLQYGLHGKHELWDHRDIASIHAEVIRTSALRAAPVRFVKLDIEGAEYGVVEQVLDVLQPEQITLEVHTHVMLPENDWAMTFVTQAEWVQLIKLFGLKNYRLAFIDNEITNGGPCHEVQYGEYLFVNPERLVS